MDYVIVSGETIEDLRMAICERLANEWELIGGVSYDGDKYIQALRKED